MHAIPCPTCNRRFSLFGDLATYFQIAVKWEKYYKSILLGSERNLIDFIELRGDLVKMSSMQMDVEACWRRGTLTCGVQFHSSCRTPKWRSGERRQGVCKISGACVSWALHPGHRRWGLRLCSEWSESQMAPGSHSEWLHSWRGMQVCPLPVLSSFVSSLHCRLVARAAMRKCGPQGYLHRFNKNRTYIGF